jgi:hypothetical protein
MLTVAIVLSDLYGRLANRATAGVSSEHEHGGDNMKFGAGKHTYEVVEGWGKLPNGWSLGEIPAVACDSQDRVFLYSRSEHPLTVFDRDGRFLASWGEGFLKDAHGIFIDADDNVFCTDRASHCVYVFNRDGELTMTLGTPGQPGADGEPFRIPTDAATASTGEIYVSDGYGNRRVHRFTPGGERIQSWGEGGNGPGQFALVHCVRVDPHDRVWICDRENRRIQVFDPHGNYLTEWTGLNHPNTVYFDAREEVVYVAELYHQVSVYTMDGELLAQWGGGKPSETPGEFRGGAHGIWADSHGDLYVGQVWVHDRLQKFARVG